MCTDVAMSEYKSRYLDNTDDPQDVGLSSDDEATGMKESPLLQWASRQMLPVPLVLPKGL